MAASPEPAGAETLSGVLERIVYASEEDAFTIGELRPQGGGKPVTIAGKLPGVQCGETLKLSGEWTNHREHGRQFRLKSFEATLPSDVHGIRKYLGSGLIKGIGKAYATRIVDHFGVDTLRVLSEESGRLHEVPGIGRKRVRTIKAAWEEQYAARELMIFLQTYGVGTAQCVKMVKRYGAQARHILENEPYRVAREMPGIGFRTADQVARNLGFKTDSPARIEAGTLFALQTLEDEGHTAAPREWLVEHAAKLLAVPPELEAERVASLLQARIPPLLETKALIAVGVNGDELQLPLQHAREERIAASVTRLLEVESGLPPIKVERAIEWAQEQAGFAFAEAQAEGVRAALTSKVSILTGGPGTGKTTILRALVDILKAKKVEVVLASPTGRAAQRMASAARAHAQTIHRLLAYSAEEGRFTVDEARPLAAGFVIVDEASMLDSALASALLRAVPSRAHLLLVGDTDQLPSVGPGNVLFDLIESRRVAVTRLTSIFRQREQSSIVTLAHDILHGAATPPGSAKRPEDLDPRHDLHFLHAPDAAECAEAVVALCAEWIPQHYRTVDPVHDVQVLAPLHKGVAGIQNLGTRLQERLNPEGPALRTPFTTYRVGDKVIQTRNDYDKGVFNGDVGRIERLTEGGGLLARIDGREVEYARGELYQLQLAYALSVHKAQGSEYPVVVLPLVKAHFLMLRRNLLYTGLTRAKRKVFFVGDPAAYAMAVHNAEAGERRTDLVRKLRTPLDV